MDDKLARESCDTEPSITNCSEDTVKVIDRFHAIREKLDKLTVAKSTHKQMSTQQRIGSKLQAIQSKFIQQSYKIEQKTSLFKEMLMEMKLSFQQRQKQTNNLIRKRKNEIKQLKTQIEQCFYQQKSCKQSAQKSNIQKFCKEASFIEQSFVNQVEFANQQINSMQDKFQHALPRLHQCIVTSNKYLACKINKKAKDAIQESKCYQKQLLIEQSHEEQCNKQIKQLISQAIDQIKQELISQRKQRRNMKEKIEFIILTASKRIHTQ